MDSNWPTRVIVVVDQGVSAPAGRQKNRDVLAREDTLRSPRLRTGSRGASRITLFLMLR
jgi:hypothetical protein